MDTVKEPTTREWLQGLTNRKTSTNEDGITMENLLHKIGLPEAKVVAGIVYPLGKGEMLDIHSVARMILEEGDEK